MKLPNWLRRRAPQPPPSEADKSLQRQRLAQRHVITPLREAAARNQFADVLRASLTRENP